MDLLETRPEEYGGRVEEVDGEVDPVQPDVPRVLRKHEALAVRRVCEGEVEARVGPPEERAPVVEDEV